MALQESNYAVIVDRLEKLERQNRQMKLAGAVALVLAASVVLMGQVPVTRTVEANQFILKDGDGKVRADLAVNANGAGLTLYDPSGKVRAMLTVTPAGPGLSLHDAKGHSRVLVGADDTEDSFAVGFNDEKGTQRVALGFQHETGKLYFFDTNQRPRIGLLAAEQLAGLTIFDDTGEVRGVYGMDRGRPVVRLRDENGKVVWQAP